MAESIAQIASFIGFSVASTTAIIVIISVWEVVWTGLAMWRAAKKNHLVWFIVFFILSLLAIPEIVYLVITKEKAEVNVVNKKFVIKKRRSKK